MDFYLFLKRYGSSSLFLSLFMIVLTTRSAIAQYRHPSATQSPSLNTTRASLPDINAASKLPGPAVQSLTNIYATDWQYLQFRGLADRYRFPSQLAESLQHKPSLSRQEFAIALAALTTYLIQQQQSLPRRDQEVLQTLHTSFSAELNLLTQRTDRMTPQLAKLEKTQFSTTTQLEGEVLFAGIGIGGDAVEDETEIDDRRITFGYRARLNLITSFTGRDRLRLRLQASSIGEVDEATGTNMTRPSFQSNTDGELILNRLDYQFPIGKRTEIFTEVIGGSLSNFADDLNPELGSSSRGTVSRFGVRNPIYRHSGSTGIGLTHEFSQGFFLSLGYLAEDANEVEEGLLGGSYGAIAQLTYQPSKRFGIGINYIRSFNALDTNTGSERANDPFNEASEAIVADSFGLQSTVQIAPKIHLGGWVGFTRAQAPDLPGDPIANILNWAITLAVLDVGAQNSLLGIVVGQPPKLIQNQYAVNGEPYIDPGTSFHLEAFYRWPIRENVAVTAGILVVTNPEHNTNNDTTYVVIIRTLFRF
jgi:hypothetical protein